MHKPGGNSGRAKAPKAKAQKVDAESAQYLERAKLIRKQSNRKASKNEDDKKLKLLRSDSVVSYNKPPVKAKLSSSSKHLIRIGSEIKPQEMEVEVSDKEVKISYKKGDPNSEEAPSIVVEEHQLSQSAPSQQKINLVVVNINNHSA